MLLSGKVSLVSSLTQHSEMGELDVMKTILAIWEKHKKKIKCQEYRPTTESIIFWLNFAFMGL